MVLFEQIANSIEEVTQSGIDWDKYNEISCNLSRKLQSHADEVITGLKSDLDPVHSEEFLEKVWDFLHAGFFMMVFSQPNLKDSLENALAKFEPRIRGAHVESMSPLERKSYEELERIVEISRQLLNTHFNEGCDLK